MKNAQEGIKKYEWNWKESDKLKSYKEKAIGYENYIREYARKNNFPVLNNIQELSNYKTKLEGELKIKERDLQTQEKKIQNIKEEIKRI